uniref:Uncharacterized protein n=1 Tax=Chenopodium quinoa TaxID=63459 RepID=A0A803MU33_CHEQI
MISIPFQPLLERISDCLQFPKPVYGLRHVGQNSAYVRVCLEIGSGCIYFTGGNEATVEASREDVAQKAVRSLMNRYGACVDDFTLGKVNFMVTFSHRRVMPLPLRNRRCFAVLVESKGFICWIMLSCSRTGEDLECVFNDPCSAVAVAEQKAAKKAITYLAHCYSLKIIDVNHGNAMVEHIAGLMWRERRIVARTPFIVIKKRSSHGLTVTRPECVTPTDECSKIPTSASPPAAPVRERACSGGTRPVAAVSASSNAPSSEDLEALFKRARIS